MNIASFIQPKAEVSYLRDDMSLALALKALRESGYTAIPVIDREDRYVGVVSEGDFLWNILGNPEHHEDTALHKLEFLTVRDIIQGGKIKAVFIDTNMEQLLEQAKQQNFVPVVDDRSVFIGIVTRRDIITYFMKHKSIMQK